MDDNLVAEYDELWRENDDAEWDAFLYELEQERRETELRWYYYWEDVMTHDRAGYRY